MIFRHRVLAFEGGEVFGEIERWDEVGEEVVRFEFYLFLLVCYTPFK